MKILRKIFAGIVVLTILIVLVVRFQVRDRHPGYRLDLRIEGKQPKLLNAGFSAVSITPDIIDTWNDADGNGRYEPEKGDTFNDLNNNGKFDAWWLAGFHNSRPANGIHDSIWARTMIIDDGNSRVALVSLDAIGFFHDQVIEVRKKLSPGLKIDYCMVASTHVHEVPDLMGIWGPSTFKTGVNRAYRDWVVNRIVRSVEEAVSNLEPVSLHFSQNDSDAVHLVTDTRLPVVHDPRMYLIEARRRDGTTKGTLVSWANHPETLWSRNLMITSDFPHFFRQGIEEARGGLCVYFNGAIGGLITTHPSVAVAHPVTGEEILQPSFEKAQAQGMILTEIALRTMEASSDAITEGSIGIRAKTFSVPFQNRMFRMAAALKLIDRGMQGWWKVRTEVAAISIGPMSILTIPGEIYPEIVNGGIESPDGQDFRIDPVEVPPLRELMPGKYRLVIGMANDELGYFIPKSQWDNKEPWLYNSEKATYGEINSLGPETAPIIHRQAAQMLREVHSKYRMD